jgi:hypothetical protein
LEDLSSTPGSGVIKIGDTYFVDDPLTQHFDAQRYFEAHGIDPNATALTTPDGTPVTYAQEYARQLSLQEAGLNDLTVSEWQLNMNDYNVHGRMNTGDQAARADALDGADIPGEQVNILHGPDQRAGGRPEVYDGLGSAGVNQSIGAQWRTFAPDLQRAIRETTAGIPPDLLPFVHMNVRLTM